MEIVIVGLGTGGLYASKSALSFNRKCHATIIEKRNFDMFSSYGLPKKRGFELCCLTINFSLANDPDASPQGYT